MKSYNFEKSQESRIIRLAVFSFLGPPMGWMSIIIASELLPWEGVWLLMTNPFFYLYCGVFLSYSVISSKKLFRDIRKLADVGDLNSLQKLINGIPLRYFLFTATYGILGPPAVTFGLGFSDYVFYFCWILGPVVISTFSIPFFNEYIRQIGVYLKDVPLERAKYFSLQRRLNISIIYLVVGVLTMLSLVFYNIVHQVQLGEEITVATIVFKLAGFSVLGAFIVGMPLFLISRQLSLSLSNVGKYLNTFKEGHLGQHLEIDQRDEIGFLMNDAFALSTHFAKIMGSLKTSSDTINRLGSNIKQAANVVASSSDQHKKGGELVQENLRTILTNATKNAENATILNKEADLLKKDLDNGNAELGELNNSLVLINDKLGRLNDMTSQTNLLALNAAVEASNAGEHGKGFSVIASEIRKLADNSKDVSAEIGDLITQIVDLGESFKEKFGQFSKVVDENNVMGKRLLDISKDQQKHSQLVEAEMSVITEQLGDLSNHADQLNNDATVLNDLSVSLKDSSDYFTIETQ